MRSHLRVRSMSIALLLATVPAVPLAGGGPAENPTAESQRAAESRPTVESAAQAPAGSGGEVHLANVRQLTFGGENAEAYFSFDGQKIIFQSTREGVPCDQIFTMNLDGSDQRMVSTSDGRTTCGYFYPDGKSIIYASTHLGGAECPPPPSFRMGYVWAIYDSYDIFRANPDGTGLTRLTHEPGYDAEPTIGPDGRVVFTSVRDGDMEIYSMNGDGSDVRRLTHRQGPDGGAFFSPDGSKIIFRGREIPDGPEYDDFKRLLDAGTLAAHRGRGLRHGRRRQQRAAGDRLRRGQLRPVLASRRRAHHLLVEHAQPGRPQLRICS